MNNSKVKKLDLGIGFMGGSPTVYARNVMEHGDFAKVCSLTGSSYNALEDNDKILIEMRKNFNTEAYLKMVKDFLLGINSTITFANDCPTGNFIEPTAVLEKAESLYVLMSFEKEAILINPAILHRIYLSALKKNEDPYGIPLDFRYEIESGNLYPYFQVYRAVSELV
ncbi:hypothetical protein [Acinetobacter sp. TGL-Y2]|uniref:hypothetical protein n=1 Tax=Acinetobacter sp. TGL-Y2 TaxID=1407071 RepID=UPI000A7ACF47|nr:hypothetical protein [Acinetobacter sp. TGL-Y2]